MIIDLSRDRLSWLELFNSKQSNAKYIRCGLNDYNDVLGGVRIKKKLSAI